MKRTITTEKPFSICFVCLGNICRSPTAEGILQHLINKEGLQSFFTVDSAGTSAWHVGEPANSNSRQIAGKYGVALKSRARRFEAEDLDHFDLILAMDEENFQNLLSLARNSRQKKKIRKLREFDTTPGDGNVPDPYHGGIDGFENVYRIVFRSSENLLDKLKKRVET